MELLCSREIILLLDPTGQHKKYKQQIKKNTSVSNGLLLLALLANEVS